MIVSRAQLWNRKWEQEMVLPFLTNECRLIISAFMVEDMNLHVRERAV